MAFPTSPSNNQVHKEGNRAFVYDSALGVWDQVRETDSSGILRKDGESISSAVTGYTGIKETDVWRLHTNWNISSGTVAVLSSNLERDDSSGFGRLGTGMSESSGVFTFPSTGIWHVAAHGRFRAEGASRTWVDVIIDVVSTTNSIATTSAAANTHYMHCSAETYVDISDTATKTVRFRFGGSNTIMVLGSTSQNHTYMVFTRIGDR